LDETENGICDGKIIADRLEFLGAVAISDPVRKEVPGAIDECQRAGINVKIVTGDTPATAVEIGRQVGLWTDNDSEQNVITGPEFEKLSDEELDNRVLDIKIISRARPMDKKRLVEFLQKKGQVVAVTGDGTNDAPALNAAHVGLSMGDGTSVAKEASDITIVDNSFSSISLAVMWGRSLYKNIQRFILFQLIVNVVACLTVLIGAFIGTENPITVTQMLWVNLIMDTFAAMALASLPPSKSVMNEKPRKRTDFIINRSMGVNIVVTGLLFTSLLIFLLLVFKQLKVDSIVDVFYPVLDGAGISEYELSLFFTIFVMLQFWNMFNAMAFDTKQSIFKQKNSKGFITIALLIIIGQILIVTFGGQMFNVTPLKIIDWIIIILSTSFVLWIKEIIKQIFKS
jgi:Ca2+-transporting ATPase